MDACQGIDVYLHSFLTSSLDGSELLPLGSGFLPPGEETPVPTDHEALWAPESF